ncbi:hypothetical protein [Ferrovibrio sp.]|uniref:hypothetical protein n=1 Tax=Ferrovibrio sp. TaxID=1917215 RepID=UPI003D0D4396
MPMSFIEPSYPADTEVAQLRTAELFGMAAFRLWAAPYLNPDTDHPDWRLGFAAAGIGCGGLGGFDTLMLLLSSAASRPLEARCLHCTGLSRDEGLFLQLISHLQQGRADLAAAVLGQWLPPAAVRVALEPAEALAEAMAGAGLVMPRRRALDATDQVLHSLHGGPQLVWVH